MWCCGFRNTVDWDNLALQETEAKERDAESLQGRLLVTYILH